MVGRNARHVGIALQSPHVVQDRGALFERQRRDPRLDGIDRHRQPKLHDLPQHRAKPGKLVVERNRFCTRIGARGLRADVDDVGALGRHPPRMRDRGLWVDEFSAVGK